MKLHHITKYKHQSQFTVYKIKKKKKQHKNLLCTELKLLYENMIYIKLCENQNNSIAVIHMRTYMQIFGI